ncbi:MAG: cysteine peptidase family C39 domain-containing protein [Bacteroides sp.]|nr:cysteine peptidase family C39 domain-containing protein [Bacteroides sp.]
MKTFTKPRNSNLLCTTLSLLHVKYTKKYSEKYFNEHPYKNNMFGLSEMFNHFGVKNIGIKVENKDSDIYELETPFIGYIPGYLILVEKITNSEVSYQWNGQKIKMLTQDFINIWTGAALIVEADKNSIEPHYKENKKKSLSLISNLYFYLQGLL